VPATSFLGLRNPSIAFTVNGKPVSVTADGDTPLLDVLRNHLGLVGTKFGCGLEQCGTCMVLIDGQPTKSCGKAVSTVAGKNVLTIEGLGTPERPHPLQQAFLDEQAGQCSYCLPGILITAKALDCKTDRLGSRHNLRTRSQIRRGPRKRGA
jgi:nicotinate dehydrogenase subunit A